MDGGGEERGEKWAGLLSLHSRERAGVTKHRLLQGKDVTGSASERRETDLTGDKRMPQTGENGALIRI